MSQKQTGRIHSVTRIRSSYYGNPRYRIALEDSPLDAWNTATDHALNYEIGNPGYRKGDRVTITIGGRGTIITIEPTL